MPKETPLKETPKQTEAEKIWNEIKNKEIQMFSLPGRIVMDFCEPVLIEPSKCFLTYKASALLPALEEVICKNFTCEVMNKFIVVSRKING